MKAFKRPDLIPLADAARRLGCSVRTLQRIARDGGLTFVRRGRFAFVLQEDLNRVEVDGSTGWLVARLTAASAERLTVAEWFRDWVELQRLTVDSASEGPRLEAIKEVVAEVIAADGERPMEGYEVGDLARTLDLIRDSQERTPGLYLISRWPGRSKLLHAYRELARRLTGWQHEPGSSRSRRRRTRSIQSEASNPS